MWPSIRSLTAVALLASRSLADLHHLYTSSYTSPDIFILEFNDQARTLKQVQQFTANGTHPSLSFSYDKTVIYAGQKGGWASYDVGGDKGFYALTFNASVPILGSCANKFADYQWGFPTVTSEAKGPYMVYGAPLGDCGNAIAVTTELAFDYISQNITYNKPGSAIRGMAMDADNTVLYSADLGANGIWVHSIDAANGLVSNIGFLPSHLANAGPRKIVVHPGGKYLYVLLERANLVAVYAVNKKQANGYPAGPISFTGLTYSLLPKGENPANYWGADISLSEDGFMLLMTTRYRLPSLANSWDTVPAQGPYVPPLYQYYQPTTQQPYRPYKEKRRAGSGYVTALQLTPNEDGSGDPATYGNRVGPGYPLRVLFQEQTSASGGLSNNVAAAPGSNLYFAITDSEYGVVEVWKITGNETPNFGGNLGDGALTSTLGGWVMGTWSSSATLTYENQYAPDTPQAANPLLPTPAAGGFNTTVPRPFVPSYYQSPPGRPGSTPTPAPQPAVQQPQPAPSPQPQQPQPYRPQPYQPYRPSQPQYPQPQYPQQPYQIQPNQPQYPQYTQYPQYPQGSQYQQARPQPRPQTTQPYRPYTSQDTSWDDWKRSRVAGKLRRWLGYEEIEKRQYAPVPALTTTPGFTPVSAKVYAAWQAGYVKSVGTQAGCCTNAIWYD